MDPITATMNAVAAIATAYGKTLDLMMLRYESMSPEVRAEREKMDWEVVKWWMGVLHTLNPSFPAPPAQ